MPQAVEPAQVDGHARGPRDPGEGDRVGQQDLLAADLHHHRRQAGEVRGQRGGLRRSRERGRAPAQPDRLQHRVGPVGPGGAGQVQPRGDQAEDGGQRLARVAQPQRRRQGQPPARGVAGQRGGRRVGAPVEQLGPRRPDVVERRGIGVLRGEPVVQEVHRGARRGGEVSRERPVGGRGADGEAAAVQVQHRASGNAVPRLEHLGRAPAQGAGADVDVRRQRRGAGDQFQPAALHAHGEPRVQDRTDEGPDGGPHDRDGNLRQPHRAAAATGVSS